MVYALLSGGAKVDLLTGGGASPLYVACSKGRTEVVQALLSAGAAVNLQTKGGISPMQIACHVGHTEVVRALLSGGAMVDLLASDGRSPLHTACLFHHMGAVRALLSAGARADLRDINGMTPLDLVPYYLHAKVGRLVQQAKMVRGCARANESRVVAPSAPATVLPHDQSASQPQAASEDGGDSPSEGPGELSAEASSISGRAASGHVCSMCGGPPSPSSAGGVAKLKACGRCLSVHYCSQECQKKHWGEGGHKEACPQLREKRERKKGGGAGD